MKNIKKVITVFIIFSISIVTPYTIKCYGNIDLTSKEKVEKLIESQLLSESSRKSLILIKEKIEKNESLIQEEVEIIQECEQEIIIKKIGEERFEEYKKLVEKRRDSKEFTQEERYRIYEIEKEIKEYK